MLTDSCEMDREIGPDFGLLVQIEYGAIWGMPSNAAGLEPRTLVAGTPHLKILPESATEISVRIQKRGSFFDVVTLCHVTSSRVCDSVYKQSPGLRIMIGVNAI